MPELAISILNYRTADLTCACLESVRVDTEGLSCEIVVVDNASGDGSAETIAAWIADHPDVPVRLIVSETNGGFSAGHNQAIAATTADFVLILNSDAELRPGCARALLAAAAETPKAGILSARLEGTDGVAQTSCFRDPTPMSELIRGANSGPVTKLLQRWNVPLGPDPDPGRVQWTAFACAMVRRETIQEIGALDNGYFLYFEDVEYCRRARHAGWHVSHVPEARALHHVGGSTGVTQAGAETERKPAYFYAARSRFFAQCYGRIGLWAANLCWLFGRALAQIRRVAGKSVPPKAAREGRDLWRNALRPLTPVSPAGKP